MKRWCLAVLAVLAGSSAFGAKDATEKPAKGERTAVEIYEAGLRHMRQGAHTRALEDFNRVRNYFRDDPLSVKAELAIADLYFKKGDLEQARFAYEEFATYHPRHPDLDYVTWRTGYAIYKQASKYAGRDQSATRSAVNAWTGFDTRFPDSEHALEVARLLQKSRDRLAKKELRIAEFYAGRKKWVAAKGRTEKLVQRYPDSEHVSEALGLWGTSLHRTGDVAAAQEIRARLAERADAARSLARLDRQLGRPPGEPPVDEVFFRPYRIRGGSMPGPAAQGAGAPSR
ncbi:MAG: outer membrane protein assembly factor BamD [Deltaproteobacteria bacterium]|nr:outer membrane protein assembly factor BamD [Deltaproteobacteria bacterium]